MENNKFKDGSFQQRKKDVLRKNDKSGIGSWDEKILELCEKINSLDNYYTTSSCSGRAIFFRNVKRDKRDVTLKRYHEVFLFEELKRDLIELSKKEKEVNFKFESCIIHIACKNVESMKLIFEKAKLAGWKNIGAISFKERFILDLRSTEKIEFPILGGGEIIVDDDFLKIIVKEANEKLRIGWEKIKRLEKNV